MSENLDVKSILVDLLERTRSELVYTHKIRNGRFKIAARKVFGQQKPIEDVALENFIAMIEETLDKCIDGTSYTTPAEVIEELGVLRTSVIIILGLLPTCTATLEYMMDDILAAIRVIRKEIEHE